MKEREISYNELKERLRIAEEALEAIRTGRVDLIIGEKGPLLLRLKELVEENERLIRLINSVPESIILLDPDQNILRCNRAALNMFNVTADEIRGKKCCEVLHKMNKPPDECPYKRMILTKKRELHEMQIGDREYLITVDPELDENGELISYLHTATDITEKKKSEVVLRESESKYKAIFNSTGTATLIVEEDGTITMANDECTGVTGYSPDELTGRKWMQFAAPESLAEMMKNHQLRRLDPSLAPKKYEVVLINKKNEKRYAILDINMIPGTTQSVVSMLDITDRKLAETALIRSEENFRNLFENHSAVKLLIDPSTGNIIEANKAAVSFYGWTREELKLMNISQINTLPPEEVKKKMQQALTWEKTHFDFIHRKADGTVADVEVFSSSIDLGGKKVLHSIIHNVTEKKKAEAQLRLLRRAVENTIVSLMITDVSGNLVYVNPGFTRITGYDQDEVIGQNPRFLKSGKQDNEFYKIMWDTILTGKTWEGELINKRKNGETYWEKAIISPITDVSGKITHFVGVKEEITELKLLIEELVKAKEKAEESSRLKSAFLANISHEIRTPLNGILGFSELLRNPVINAEEKETFLRLLKESGERMLSTINQIIEVSKIETGTVTVDSEHITLEESINYFYNFFKQEAEKKGLKFTLINNLPPGLLIRTDKYKFESVLQNLLRNAIRFTESGSVEFRVETGNKEIVFTVIDTGPGIPAAMHEKIFERFVQADTSYSRPYEGAGLGLSIAKAYAEMLGGSIRLKSEEGTGSTFSFQLPIYQNIKQEDHIKTIKQQESGPVVPGKTILVAEDDELNYSYIETLLKKNGYTVLRAANGLEAINLCSGKTEIDLVLMDIKMPLMDGHEATRKIRAVKPRLPIIAQTAFAHDADRLKALENGCNDYISKPFTMNMLLSKISSLLSNK